MKKDASKQLTRRAALARLGVVAAVGYTVPAFTTLSTANASSDASASSASSVSSESSASSGTSGVSTASEGSFASLPSDHGLNDTQKDGFKQCSRTSENQAGFEECVNGIDGVSYGDLFPS